MKKLKTLLATAIIGLSCIQATPGYAFDMKQALQSPKTQLLTFTAVLSSGCYLVMNAQNVPARVLGIALILGTNIISDLPLVVGKAWTNNNNLASEVITHYFLD